VSRRRTLGLFVLVSLLFGGVFVAVKAGLAYFPPLLFVSLRFDLAALLLGAYAVHTASAGELRPRTRGDVVGILATGGLTIGLANALIFVGQQYASSAVGSIIFSLNPILTPVFAAGLLADERLAPREAAGMLVGLAGVALVVDPDPSSLLGGALLGKAVLFAGAATGALGTVLIRWADTTLSSTVRTAWGLPLSALLTHAMSALAGESVAAIAWTPAAVAALAYVGILAGAVAYFAYFDLIDDVGAVRANLVFYAVPVVAALGGWVLLGETITLLTVAGFVTIAGGFALIASESAGVDLPRVVDAVREAATADR
jgi:drug/metabolite transporter (DMT)-like permease